MISIEEFYESNTIDPDFDELFYKKEYPETDQFYQPYCLEHHIDDKKRLFYHYIFYAPSNFKNYNDKKEYEFNFKFVPIKNKRLIKSNKLAIITSFFNPCNYKNIRNNYKTFSDRIKKYADLFPIELSLENEFFITDANCIRISGDLNNALWQKELLLNLALEKLPKEYTDVAWIDCDIIFEDENWVSKLSEELEQYKICQLFSKGKRLEKNGEKKSFLSLVGHYPHGVPGFAWAGRREVLDEIKFLDNQILGGADFIMASAFLKKPKMIFDLKSNYINNFTTQEWIDKAINVVDGSVSFLDVSITHLYHGSINNRKYTNRYEIIKDEKLNIYKNQIWTIKDKHLQDKILDYFYNRKEDDNI